MTLAHHQHTVGLCGFFHIVSDGHHRDAHVPVQVVDGLHHLLAAARVQHGGGFVQDQAVRAHGNHTGNGHALLLTAGKVVGCALAVFVDAGHLHGVVHPAAHLVLRHAEVFQRKGHVLFHHSRHDLVVRVLEHHAHSLADIVKLVLVCGIHALHIHLAALRQQNGVEVLGQRGFTTAVCTQHRHELPALYLRRYAVQRIDRLLGIVAELQIFSS